MAQNKIVFEVIASEKGLRLVTKDVENLGRSHTKTKKQIDETSKATGELNYRLNQGVTGVSSAARSFSKLNQAIGSGPNGLVGAYATLAANIFALSAAFNALREAAQVEQVLRGLETQGARTGRTLTLAAKQLQETTGFAISAAEAMRSTALISSAGFDGKAIQQLGDVATNAALALGRNVPDALDRITKGVTKLEPELLDELGIMTKLTEATATFARENNKTANSLTSFEKRQAFLNAVLAEGQLKFAGIQDEIGINPYDQLAASFDNLTKSVFSMVNILGKALATLGAINPATLGGGILLFGSTISKQLIPALYEMSDNAIRSRDALLEQSKAARASAAARVKDARQIQQDNLANLRNLEITKAFPKAFRDKVEIFKEGTKEVQIFDREINRLNASLRIRERQLNTRFAGTAQEAEKVQAIKDITDTRDKLISLKEAELNVENSLITSTKESQAATRNYYALKKAASAQEIRANAIALAGQGELRAGWAALTASVKEYSIAVSLARRAEGAGGVIASGLDKARVAAFAAGTAVRQFGAALLNYLPYLGLITIGFGLAKEAYKALFETEEERIKKKNFEALNEVIVSTEDKLKELERAEQSLASASLVTTQQLVIHGNTIAELADTALKAIAEIEQAAEDAKRGANQATLFEALFGSKEDTASYLTGLDKNSKFIKSYVEDLGSNYTAGELIAIQGIFGNAIDKDTAKVLKAIDQLTEAVGGDLAESFINAYGGAERLKSSEALRTAFISDVQKNYQGLSTSVKQLEESFKQADIASQDFINSVSESTRYDKILKAFQDINTSIGEIPSVISSADVNKLLTGIQGTDTQKFLSAETQALIENYNIQRDIVNEFEKKRSIGEKITGAEIEQNYLAKRALNTYTRSLSVIKDELKAIEQTLKVNQENERLGKARIALIQTELQVYSDIYSQTVSGTIERLERENEVLDIQKAQNSAQIAINSSLIRTTEIRQKIIEDQLEELELLKEKNIEIDKAALRTQQQAAFVAGLTAAEVLSGKTDRILNNSQKSILDNLNLLRDELNLIERKSDLLAEQAANEKYIQDIRAANQALALLNEKLDKQSLTSAEIEAEANKVRVKILNEQNSAIEKNIASYKVLQGLQRKYLDVLSGSSAAPFYEVQELTRKLEADRTEVINRVTSEIREAQANLNKLVAQRNAAQSRGDSAAVKAASELIDTQQKSIEYKIADRELTLAILDTTYELELAEKLIIKSREEGLEIQQRSLEGLNKYIGLQKNALGQEQELREILAETAAIKRNSPLSEKAKQALELQSLREQLQFEKDTLSIRKTGIELEYELLEAKKQLLVERLKVQASILKDGDPAKNLIQASIANLEEVTYKGLKDLALASEDRAIAILEAKVERAQATLLNIGNDTTFFDKLLGTVDDAALILSALNPANDIKKVNDTVVESPVVLAQRENTEALITLNTSVSELSEATLQLLRDSNTDKAENNDIINKLIPTLNSGNLDISSANSAKEALMQMGQYAESLKLNGGIKLKVEEFKGVTPYNPGAHRGAAHPAGLAFDLNAVGPGGQRYAEAQDKYLGPIFDKLAEEFRALGATVLFRTKGHYDHMHVEFTKTIDAANKKVTDSANASMNEEIVVTAPKRVEPSNTTKSLATGASLLSPLLDDLAKLSPQGGVASAAIGGLMSIGVAISSLIDSAEQGGLSFRNLASVANQTLQVVSTIAQASSNAKIAAIDKEIAAEQKRDGQSAKSVAKIQALEKKKEQAAKKAFEINKKVQMAQTVIATAAAVVQALKNPPGPPFTIPLAVAAGAMGAAQLAIIAGQSYNGGGSTSTAVQTPSAFSIGRRSNEVDLGKGPNVNAGGESGFLRGSSGYGSNAFNYNTIGSPYGGRLDRGYGNRGFLVGEKGVERIEPEVPLKVTPNSQLKEAGTPINATFNVNTLDSRGVEEVLISQKGNIIKMLRDAANSTGEGFLEDVDVNVYTSPNVSRI